MTGRMVVITFSFAALLPICGCSRGSVDVPTAKALEAEPEQAGANLRVSDAVALATVHFESGEYQDGERVLTEVISKETAATNKAEAIALLGKIKAAAKASRPSAESPQVAVGPVPPIIPSVAPGSSGGDPANSANAETGGANQAAAEPPAAAEEPKVVESDSDAVQPGERQPATETDVRRVLKEADGQASADEAVKLLERFASLRTLSGEWKPKFDQELAAWKERAAKKLVRNGRDWIEPAEYQRLMAEADSLIQQAFQLLRVGNASACVDILEKASKTDRNGIRADFLLGLIYTLAGPSNLKKAENHYEEVLRRQPNHISAMNNLAVILTKEREYEAALRNWRKAIDLAPKTPAISQNLGRLVAAASDGKLPMTPAVLRRFSDVYAELTASGKGLPADPQSGWHFMPLYLARDEQKRQGGDGGAKLVDIGSGSGFVVAEGYVLTNRHVVRDEAFGDHDAYAIIAPGNTNKEYAATLTAVSADADLAVLRCPGLDLPPVPVETEVPGRGSEVLILGYPKPGVVGVGLKATQGIVTALPEPTTENMLLFDATANPGNSGGPVLTRRGSVCGVLTAILLTEQGYSAGVPCTTAVDFVRKVLPDWKPDAVPAARLEWSDVDTRVGPSTVRILCRRQEVKVAVGGNEKDTDGYLRDRSCCVCNGAGIVPCPAKGCVKGVISVPTQGVVGYNPIQERAIYGRKFVKENCPRCSGKGSVDCPYCHNGVDPAIR